MDNKMKVRKIQIEDFKRIANVELDLSDVNILVGANSSGKSSVLQAIHLTSCLMRQADRIRANGTSPVSTSELDYLPTDSYSKLGHGKDWGNQSDSPRSRVSFVFEAEGAEATADATFRSARNNAGISVSGTLPDTIRDRFRGTGKFFSAYSPGISGIPNEEQKQSKRVVLKACSHGDANAYLRNALLLLNDDDNALLEGWLEKVIGPIKVRVKHNNDNDLNISASATIGENECPLELLGMGYLQLIQIFCYLLLFKPHVMLIDEPDIHLHPNVQERLPRVLSEVAKDQDTKIILSTHSPFIVRGAPIDARVLWMDQGVVKNNSRQSIELALGWGAFGKKIILFSEDEKTELLKHIIAQWPEIEKLVAVHPGNGHSNLIKPAQAEQLKQTLGDSFKIVIHRDRDSMTDDEVTNLKGQYDEKGASLWVTDSSDIEAYFCDPKFLQSFLAYSEADTTSLLEGIINPLNRPNHGQFTKQRKSINNELYGGVGNSPASKNVWDVLQQRPLKAAKGKTVFKELKNKVPSNKFSEMSIQLHVLDGTVATSLKTLLENLLQQP